MRLMAFFVLALVGNPLWESRAGAQGTPPVITDDLDRGSLRLALQRSLEFLQKVPPQRILGEWPRKIAAQEIRESLILFERGLNSFREPRALGAWFNARFELFPAARDPSGALFTGYYRPVLNASLRMDKRHRFPIYGKPAD